VNSYSIVGRAVLRTQDGPAGFISHFPVRIAGTTSLKGGPETVTGLSIHAGIRLVSEWLLGQTSRVNGLKRISLPLLWPRGSGSTAERGGHGREIDGCY